MPTGQEEQFQGPSGHHPPFVGRDTRPRTRIDGRLASLHYPALTKRAWDRGIEMRLMGADREIADDRRRASQ